MNVNNVVVDSSTPLPTTTDIATTTLRLQLTRTLDKLTVVHTADSGAFSLDVTVEPAQPALNVLVAKKATMDASDDIKWRIQTFHERAGGGERVLLHSADAVRYGVAFTLDRAKLGWKAQRQSGTFGPRRLFAEQSSTVVLVVEITPAGDSGAIECRQTRRS